MIDVWMLKHSCLAGINLTWSLLYNFYIHCWILFGNIFLRIFAYGGSMGKASACMWENWVWSLGQEVPLEKEMASHTSTLAWKIPWTEEPGKLQSMGCKESYTTEQFHFFIQVMGFSFLFSFFSVFCIRVMLLLQNS